MQKIHANALNASLFCDQCMLKNKVQVVDKEELLIAPRLAIFKLAHIAHGLDTSVEASSPCTGWMQHAEL
jgi:hypothetical protein